MPIRPGSTENNENLQDVSVVQNTSTAADGLENRSPQSLLDMCIPLIAQDPSLSLMFINNFSASNITDVLKKITPFIQLLPTELKCEIIMFLPLQDWKSLWKVSSEWRQVVSAAAEIFLNQVVRDKLPLIPFDLDEMLKNLQDQINYYDRNPGGRGRAGQVQKVKKLIDEVGSFKYPLTELIHCKKKIKEIQEDIEGEYSYSFFGGATNSRLYQILGTFHRNSQKVTESSWFQKIKFCANLYPEHAVTKQLEDMFLEIKECENKVPVKAMISSEEEDTLHLMRS